MKSKYILYSLISLSVCFHSCDDFLNINPDSEVINDDIFSSANGVEDALYGIYVKLTGTSLYGEKLSWAYPEVLSQDLSAPNITTYNQLEKYVYNDVQAEINAIWSDLYEVIGYTNNIITNLEQKNTESFEYYNLYLGEAYGLRASMHFELLRWFSPHIENGNTEAQGIPYVTTYSFEHTSFSTVSEVYTHIITDLKKAQDLLNEDEAYVTFPRVFEDPTTENFLNGRETHFNYYAATATLARVYRMMGDYEKGKVEALKVIDSEKFPLAESDEIVNVIAGTLSPKESIWGLYSDDYLPTTELRLFHTTSFSSFNPFHAALGGSYLQPYDAVYNQYLGEGSGSDARLGWFRPSFEGAPSKNCLKVVDVLQLNSSSNTPASRGLTDGISMIRIPEMYYIVAEAELIDGNIPEATDYINEVLLSRGLTRLEDRTPALTADLDLLYNERHKELFCEGQRWFDMKKRNADIISNAENKIIPANDAVYVLPIPREEFDYRD